MSELALRVRGLRRQRGWTLERAAQATGLARSTLSKIENGQMSPTYDALTKLATGFAVDISVSRTDAQVLWVSTTQPSAAALAGGSHAVL